MGIDFVCDRTANFSVAIRSQFVLKYKLRASEKVAGELAQIDALEQRWGAIHTVGNRLAF
jgi:hypothetical protein